MNFRHVIQLCYYDNRRALNSILAARHPGIFIHEPNLKGKSFQEVFHFILRNTLYIYKNVYKHA